MSSFGKPLMENLVTWLDAEAFDSTSASDELCRRFQVQDLGAFGCENHHLALGAAGALLHYAGQNPQSSLPHLTGIRAYSVTGHMVLDETTRRNLELTRPLYGRGRSGSLLEHLDRSVTSMGGRFLKEWLLYPLMDRARIADRHDAVELLCEGRSALRGQPRTSSGRVGHRADRFQVGARNGTCTGSCGTQTFAGGTS